MIAALLILIVFILLFGAAVVKGWLANAAAGMVGFVILVGLVLRVGSFFGENGPAYVIFGGMGLLFVLAIVAKAAEPTAPPARTPVPSKPSSTKPAPMPEPPAGHRVWAWYVNDIRERFSPASRDRARALYGAGDANGLDRFCRAEIERLNEEQGETDQPA